MNAKSVLKPLIIYYESFNFTYAIQLTSPVSFGSNGIDYVVVCTTVPGELSRGYLSLTKGYLPGEVLLGGL